MRVHDLIHNLHWDDLPPVVQRQARRCLLDTVGTAIGGRQTELSDIIYDFAATAFAGRGARLWFDGRAVSPPGAALAHGMTIDALDIHDTCRSVKGHAGVALVPATLATLTLHNRTISGRELLTTLVVGYEVAIRAGKALHATAADYHTSGAWNGLGCAAITARRLGLNRDQIRHALGIAEYHGPRSPMMRVIDHPTMLKDGSGWGAMAGVSAGLLAGRGFTGAPAFTVEDEAVRPFWSDLGQEWAILEQVFKPYAVCYWAQAAIAGAVQLQQAHQIPVEAMKVIRVFTFHEATRLAVRRPQNTEEAQYSLPYPVAAALVHGELGYAQLSAAALQDPVVLDLAGRVELIEEPFFNDRFPAERLARVEMETHNGTVFDSGVKQPLWGATAPPTDDDLRAKFRRIAHHHLSSARAEQLEALFWQCADLPDTRELLTLMEEMDA